jgi:hypothetical protein
MVTAESRRMPGLVRTHSSKLQQSSSLISEHILALSCCSGFGVADLDPLPHEPARLLRGNRHLVVQGEQNAMSAARQHCSSEIMRFRTSKLLGGLAPFSGGFAGVPGRADRIQDLGLGVPQSHWCVLASCLLDL